MNTFANLSLNPKIHQAINACGYITPTEIQLKSIPLILNGVDLIGATETGSGKTAAFMLPALDLLAGNKLPQKIRILVLVPTRELATQITSAANKYGKFIDFNIANIIGGTPYYPQEKSLASPLDIIIATPGRLLDHMRKNRVDLSGLEMFVLDEADRMLDMGFIDDVEIIAKSLPKKTQTLLFTATLDKRVIKSLNFLLKNPVTVDLSKAQGVPEQIQQRLFMANHHQEKITFLENLLQNEQIYKAIIFSSTKVGADKLASHLRTKGYQALALHGDLNQRVRKKALEKLRQGKIQYLVATDVAARGIDIDISHVINFDLPRCLDDYIHRVGRTGRAGKEGEAISLATRDERHYLMRIEKSVGKRLKVINFDRSEKIGHIAQDKISTLKPKRKYRDDKAGKFKKGYTNSKWQGKRDRSA